MHKREAHGLLLEVSEPCTQSWEAMPGNLRQRYCARCSKQVHDLSTLTAHQVRRLLAGQRSEVCARVCADPDGRVVVRRSGRPTKLHLRVATASLLSAALGCAGSDAGSSHKTGHPAPPSSDVHVRGGAPVSLPVVVMGGLKVRPPPPTRPEGSSVSSRSASKPQPNGPAHKKNERAPHSVELDPSTFD